MRWWKDWGRSWMESRYMWGLWYMIVMLINYEGYNPMKNGSRLFNPSFGSLDARPTWPPRRRWWHPRSAESVPDDRPWNPAKFPRQWFTRGWDWCPFLGICFTLQISGDEISLIVGWCDCHWDTNPCSPSSTDVAMGRSAPHLQLGWESRGLFQSHGHIQQKLGRRPGTQMGPPSFSHLEKTTSRMGGDHRWRMGISFAFIYITIAARPCQKLGRGFLGFANHSFYSDQLTQNSLVLDRQLGFLAGGVSPGVWKRTEKSHLSITKTPWYRGCPAKMPWKMTQPCRGFTWQGH